MLRFVPQPEALAQIAARTLGSGWPRERVPGPANDLLAHATDRGF